MGALPWPSPQHPPPILPKYLTLFVLRARYYCILHIQTCAERPRCRYFNLIFFFLKSCLKPLRVAQGDELVDNVWMKEWMSMINPTGRCLTVATIICIIFPHSKTSIKGTLRLLNKHRRVWKLKKIKSFFIQCPWEFAAWSESRNVSKWKRKNSYFICNLF